VTISDACREVTELPKLARTSERFVFPNRDGVQFGVFPDQIFKELEDAAGISGGVHTLRHCFASNFLATTPDLYLLSQVLGHSHERITAIYAHLLPSHLEKSRNAVNIRPPSQTLARTLAERPRKAETA
jgi:site-specific recombinase XerD